MKTLSTINVEKADNPRTAPIWLMDIVLDSSLSLYLCDRLFGDPGEECVFNNITYDPLLIDWGELKNAVINPSTYMVEPTEIQSKIDNQSAIGDADRLSKLFSTYDFQYSDVTIKKIYEGTISELNTSSAWVEKAPQLNSQTWIISLIEYNDKLYGSTYDGGRLFEWNGIDAWTQVAPKLGTGGWINDLLVFSVDGKLYGGTYTDGALVQWNDTDEWVEKAPQLGGESGIFSLVEYNGNIYGGTLGGYLYEWNGFDAWASKASPFFPDFDSSSSYGTFIGVYDLIVFDGNLYGIGQIPVLMKWNDVDTWEQATSLNTAKQYTTYYKSLIIFNEELYCYTSEGYLLKYNGVDDWEEVAGPISDEYGFYSACIYNNELYLGTYDSNTGGRLVKYNGSRSFIEMAPGLTENFISSLAVYNEKIYGGTRVLGKLYEWNGGSDAIDMFAGKLEDPLNLTNVSVDLLSSGSELDLINKYDHEICTIEDYPGADPDDVGKMFPQVYGSCQRVPFLAIDAGAVTTLSQDVDDSETGEWFFTDVERFPEPDSSGEEITVQIGLEQLKYNVKDDDVRSLTITERGVNGTEAKAHFEGDGIAEVKDKYVYGIGTVSYSAPDIYVDGIRQEPNDTSGIADFEVFTGQAGDVHPSYSGKTIIEFTANPVIKRQINIDDDISISVGGSSKTVYPSGSQCSVGNCTGILDNPGNCYDGNDNTYAVLNDIVDSTTYVHILFSETNIGLISKIHVWIKCKQSGEESSGMYNDLTMYSDHQGSWAPASITPPHNNFEEFRMTLTLDTPVDDWTFYIGLDPLRAFDDTLDIHEIRCEVEYSASGTKTGGVISAANSSANIVIGGLVTADIQGVPDDSDGTITGTANSLIQRPGHEIKAILRDRCGLSLNDNIDHESYGESESWYEDNGYRLGICILEKPNPRELLQQIAYQSKSTQFWEANKHYLIYIEDNDSSGAIEVDKVIEANRIDVKGISLDFTKRADLKNKFSARYAKEWAGYEDPIEADRKVVKAQDDVSIAKYTILEGGQLEFPFIIDTAQAQDIINWITEERAFPRTIVNFFGGEYLAELQDIDVIQFSEGSFTDIIAVYGTMLQEDGFAILQENGDKILWEAEQTTVTGGTYLEDILLGLVTLDSDKFRIISNSETKYKKFIKCIQI